MLEAEAARYAEWAEKFKWWYENLALKIRRFAVASSILDVGSGSGLLIKELSKIFPRAIIVGIDKNQYMCKFSRALRSDEEAMPFKDEAFDLVVFSYSLRKPPFLPILLEAKRVLRRGGVIAVRDVNSEVSPFIKSLVATLIERNVSRSYAEEVRVLFETFPSPSFFAKLISSLFEVLYFSTTIFGFDIIGRKN
ncbi:MAG: class I SAM-dependent methyltransferase [Candidatus Nezhaarchaeota archaeon]|nr:class I SAM-dependent methyltransferase [Candidatus Nezhaarchaeota archaeon]